MKHHIVLVCLVLSVPLFVVTGAKAERASMQEGNPNLLTSDRFSGELVDDAVEDGEPAALTNVTDRDLRCSSMVVEQLNASTENERQSAMEELLGLRKKTINQLIAILNQPVKKGENWLSPSSPRNLAMWGLGEMRAKQAVPHLLQWLWPQKEQIAIVDRMPYLSPAGLALSRIGKPAVPALINVIATQGNTGPLGKVRYAITRILSEIEGKDGAKFVLGKSLDAENDPQRKERLEAALRDLQKSGKCYEYEYNKDTFSAARREREPVASGSRSGDC